MKTEFNGEPVAGGTYPAAIFSTFMKAVLPEKVDAAPVTPPSSPGVVPQGTPGPESGAATPTPTPPPSTQTPTTPPQTQQAPPGTGGGTGGAAPTPPAGTAPGGTGTTGATGTTGTTGTTP
jgi:penicillin-binding protein 1A